GFLLAHEKTPSAAARGTALEADGLSCRNRHTRQLPIPRLQLAQPGLTGARLLPIDDPGHELDLASYRQFVGNLDLEQLTGRQRLQKKHPRPEARGRLEAAHLERG